MNKIEIAAREFAATKISDKNRQPDNDIFFAAKEGFEKGADWISKQNPWRNFKVERPKPNSHILRKMIHPDYQSYRKVLYYADFWSEDRPDKWEQDNDKVIYEWQYINE